MSDLQFEQAEFKGEPAAIACASCGAAIQGTYFQVGQAITCEQCRWRLEAEASGGSSGIRFVKATMLGVVAAAIGAGAYYAVRALTGYEFGLIAVVVGLLVGGAVRMGSENRGGVPYQILAMFLTYASIVSTYIPELARAFHEQAADKLGAGALSTLVAVVVTVAIAFVAPFLMGFQNIIGIVIIAIGLYEAWKINRKPDRTVTGPFRVEEASPGAPVESPAP